VSAPVSPPDTILVTGAGGFVGGPVCQALVARGFRVRGLIRRPALLPPGVEAVQVPDLTDEAAVKGAVRGVDAVVHLAARAHVLRETDPDPIAAFRRDNVEATRVLLEAAEPGAVRSFVYVSSVKAVGEVNREAWRAATPAAPTDPYGISKLEAETLVRRMAGERGLHAPILRLTAVYGPGMRANLLRLFRLVDRGVPLPVGGMADRRSFLYLGNAVAAIGAALESPAAGGGPWFISDGLDLTTAELARRIGVALGRPARIVTVPGAVLRAVARFGDLVAQVAPFPFTTGTVRRLTESLVVDSSDFGLATGFRPPYSVEEGLALTAAWFRHGGGKQS
jgi:nucleoside-diphosphate-sugar epimerase